MHDANYITLDNQKFFSLPMGFQFRILIPNYMASNHSPHNIVIVYNMYVDTSPYIHNQYAPLQLFFKYPFKSSTSFTIVFNLFLTYPLKTFLFNLFHNIFNALSNSPPALLSMLFEQHVLNVNMTIKALRISWATHSQKQGTQHVPCFKLMFQCFLFSFLFKSHALRWHILICKNMVPLRLGTKSPKFKFHFLTHFHLFLGFVFFCFASLLFCLLLCVLVVFFA